MEIIKGTPTPVFLPAREYNFKYMTDLVTLVIPLSGRDDLVPYKDDRALLLGNVLHLLFQEGKYPNLQDNQLFCVFGFDIDREANELAVVGRVVERVEE